MNNKITYVLLAVFVLLLPAGIVSAENKGTAPEAELIQVGNKICPVSGEKVGTMGDVVTYTYEGKVYNLCCPMCIKEFDKDPEKFSQIAETEGEHQHDMAAVKDEKGKISYYTCGMHPSVKVSVENYEKGDTKCPICFMPLTPVRMGATQGKKLGENVISQVEIKAEQLKLAGVQTETVEKRQLFKEIRAVGKVAYDPQLAIAQDEYISAANSLEKARQGGIQEIMGRAQRLVESSRRKLLLLGLNEKQIKILADTKKVQGNLILPEDKMWIYGDVYEYEMNWVKEGSYVTVRPIGLAGKEFYGEVVSINPVVDPRTRSVRFRAMVDNVERKLKPGMYVDVVIMSEYVDPNGDTDVVSIPKSALLDTGRRKIVWVAQDNGLFEGRSVELGPESIAHSNDLLKFYPVLKGIKEGERVVTKGNFLIDSQSQITGIAASSYGGALEPASNQEPSHSGHGAH